MAKIAIVLVTSLGLGIGALFGCGYLRINDSGDLVLTADPDTLRPRTHCILNPLRDRGPERVGEALLEQLRREGPEALGPVLADDRPDERDRILDAERKLPLRSWRLGDRTVDGDTVELSYWVHRGEQDGPGYKEHVLLRLTRVDSIWVVRSYAAVY